MCRCSISILNEEAARAVEDHVCGHYAERGCPLTRIGKPPKRAFPFRTDEPFKKFKVGVTAPSGALEEIEFLGDGEQLACFGIHPETGRLYRWHGGEPGTIRRDDLPYIREAEARQLVDEIVGLLVGGFGYKRAPERSKSNARTTGATLRPVAVPKTGSSCSPTSTKAASCTTACAILPPRWSNRG